ncbi:uncharacterized protein [Pocillopora verrucosa]|uniref:uncharacterized protein isoform X2 n=1 Tax=Pocillopora verrucosa TaxID=203993 RepID=UPI00334289EF
MPNHFNLEDCERFLHDENQFRPGASKRIEKYLQISREGLDEFLIRFPEMIRNEDQLFYIVRFMRAHHKFDTQDHERIFNSNLFTTMERKVTELLAVVEQKDPHTYWYLMHALQSKHSPLYEHLHGSIKCCVCKDIKHREKEEELHFSDLENEGKVVVPLLKALCEAIEDKVSTGRSFIEKMRTARQNFPPQHSRIVESIEPKKLEKVKDILNPTKDWTPELAEEMLRTCTRRKRAYKAAFIGLSAITLFIFHSLPAFDFLFLFIYCNFLIMVITL